MKKNNNINARFKSNYDSEVTLDQLLMTAIKKHRHEIAYHYLRQSYSYQQLAERSRGLAEVMYKHYQLQKGDCIALMLPNCIQWPIAFLAALQLGIVITTINPIATATEVQFQLKHAQVKLLITLGQCINTLNQIDHRDVSCQLLITQLGDELPFYQRWATHLYLRYVKQSITHPKWPSASWRTLMAATTTYRKLPRADIKPQDACLILYTSGTTQRPKGVLLSHANLVVNLAQIKAALWPQINHKHPKALAALPLYHIFSLMANGLLFLSMGGSAVLIPDPRQPASLIAALRRYRITCIAGVNRLYDALLTQDKKHRVDWSGLQLCVSGGMALDASIAAQWQQVTGCSIIQAYGLSETSPAVCIGSLDQSGSAISVGQALPMTEVSIRDKSGRILASGQQGEICIKGPQVMQQYWHNQAATQQALGRGYFRTGDLGQIDQHGCLTIVDRIKDMMIVSGFNVSATAVESVFKQHPKIQQAAVIGQKDALYGDAIIAFIVKDQLSSRLTKSQCLAYCQQHLKPYEVPKKIIFCHDLPQTPLGKVKKALLRHRLAESQIIRWPKRGMSKTILKQNQQRRKAS